MGFRDRMDDKVGENLMVLLDFYLLVEEVVVEFLDESGEGRVGGGVGGMVVGGQEGGE